MSLARSLRRSSRLVRLQRAWVAALCALPIAAWSGAYWMIPLLASVAAAGPVDKARLVRGLDAANRREGRLIAAHELALLPVRTAFMEAAMRAAEAQALPHGVPLRKPGWLEALVALALLVRVLPGPAAIAPEPRQVRAPAVAPPRAPARAALDALEARLLERETSRQRALEALRPVLKTARGAITAADLHALADAVAAPKLSSAARAQLREALERARESERARVAEAQSAPQREQDRKLEQLTRPPEREPEQQPREREQAREQPEQELADALDRAAQAVAHEQDASPALRDGAEALAREQRQTQRQQQALAQQRAQASGGTARQEFEQAARGGGNEADPGEHTPAERRVGGSYQDERLRGAQGEGPSRSQVIEGASQAGFASASYRRVYTDYRAHAEQLLERDDVPPGERLYVRRYFDLVQPR